MKFAPFLVSAALLLAGVIHLVPVMGVLGSEALSRLYGLDFSEPNLAILMRHRAVLFGMLGAFLVASAFRPAWQPLALWAGFISVLSFLFLACSAGGYNPAIRGIVIGDLIALGALVVAAVLVWLRTSTQRVA